MTLNRISSKLPTADPQESLLRGRDWKRFLSSNKTTISVLDSTQSSMSLIDKSLQKTFISILYYFIYRQQFINHLIRKINFKLLHLPIFWFIEQRNLIPAFDLCIIHFVLHTDIILLMSQQHSTKKQQSQPEPTYLDTMIDCITQRNGARVVIQDPNINSLYTKANSMINQLDSGINLCKKYNEAKINRKYQIIIHDLQTQIRRLSDNLKLQQDARSPTKKHVSDILQKLVQLRTENQDLKKNNQELKDKIKELSDTMETQASALNRLQNIQSKNTIERLPPIGNTPSIAEGVKQYIKDRQQVRKITKNPVSGFEKFLNQLRPKMWNWNVGNLLQEIEKWVQCGGAKPSGEVDMWRIRSSIARKFSDYMDQPQSLLRPSLNLQSENSIWEKLQQKNSLHSGKYSYVGSKRSLNASFH